MGQQDTNLVYDRALSKVNLSQLQSVRLVSISHGCRCHKVENKLTLNALMIIDGGLKICRCNLWQDI